MHITPAAANTMIRTSRLITMQSLSVKTGDHVATFCLSLARGQSTKQRIKTVLNRARKALKNCKTGMDVSGVEPGGRIEKRFRRTLCR
jgi:hypothetical protein